MLSPWLAWHTLALAQDAEYQCRSFRLMSASGYTLLLFCIKLSCQHEQVWSHSVLTETVRTNAARYLHKCSSNSDIDLIWTQFYVQSTCLNVNAGRKDTYFVIFISAATPTLSSCSILVPLVGDSVQTKTPAPHITRYIQPFKAAPVNLYPFTLDSHSVPVCINWLIVPFNIFGSD